MNVEEFLISKFPGLAKPAAFEISSPQTPRYNCIAFAAGDERRWWEPDPFGNYYWPKSAPRAMTLDAYIAAFSSIGYALCPTGDKEHQIEKIALFATLAAKPTHAARQIPNGRWKSKLGPNHDIEHDLHSIEGNEYGFVVRFMQRVTR